MAREEESVLMKGASIRAMFQRFVVKNRRLESYYRKRQPFG